MSLARGTSGTLPIFLKKDNIVAPRIPIGRAYAQPFKVVLSGGFGPPHWNFNTLLVAQLGWLFSDIQGRETPAAGVPDADTSFTVSISVACLVNLVTCPDRVTLSYVY
jgi:hypothetical protein